jgi:membrane-associated phospholipid phosphatase
MYAGAPVPLLVALLVALALAVRHRELLRPVLAAAIAAATGEVTGEWLKPWFGRPRPDAHLALVTAVGSSFPSASAATVFAGAVAVVCANPAHPVTAAAGVGRRPCAAAGYRAAGRRRGHLPGVHWLSDVVAGAVEGGVIGYAIARVTLRRPHRPS